MLGQVGERMHGKCLYDAALIFKIIEEDGDSVVAFFWCELEARKYLGYVPPDFLLRDGGDFVEDYAFVRLQEFRTARGSFFDCVGGAHADYRIWIQRRCDDLREKSWIG